MLFLKIERGTKVTKQCATIFHWALGIERLIQNFPVTLAAKNSVRHGANYTGNVVQ